jgi:uncharacterized damage-inducible protein DinB
MPSDRSPVATLLRACAASARVNEYLIERLDPAVWRAEPPAPKMRTIAAMAAHMHNCGLAYLRQATPKVTVPPDLAGLRVTQSAAVRALAAKRRALLAALGPALERSVPVGHSKRDPIQFLTYYMVHDGHHRGQIVYQARLLGYPVSVETMNGMWLWPTRIGEAGRDHTSGTHG